MKFKNKPKVDNFIPFWRYPGSVALQVQCNVIATLYLILSWRRKRIKHEDLSQTVKEYGIESPFLISLSTSLA